MASLYLAVPPLPSMLTPTGTSAFASGSMARLQVPRCSNIKASAAVANDPSTVDYSSMTSVFPAEACETVGGEACDAEMYPEVKLQPEARSSSVATALEQVDREYMEYNSPKTVFLEEACEDLGGEFCEPEYQTEAPAP
uniref:Light-regulated protein n=3 Tax=Rhizophora mucronata TaxID=61149 RepID=A0A2P2JFG0_RHIMU